MKAVEFPVVAEARRAAHGQMGFYNRMMAAKTAANAPHKKQFGSFSKKAAVQGTPAKK